MSYTAHEIAFLQDLVAKGSGQKAASSTSRSLGQHYGMGQHIGNRFIFTEADAARARHMLVNANIAIEPPSTGLRRAEAAQNNPAREKAGTLPPHEDSIAVKAAHGHCDLDGLPVATQGHKYWSKFAESTQREIEEKASFLHETLFEPEVTRPVKTLDLPLGGPRGVRTALEALIELNLIATRDHLGTPKSIDKTKDDTTGAETLRTLNKTLSLMQRLTGNDKGSLGLHPAVYFYGPTGRHSSPMFMGTVGLFAQKLANNDSGYFGKFTKVRSELERVLVDNKDLISIILQRVQSYRRTDRFQSLLDSLVSGLLEGEPITEDYIVTATGFTGKILTGTATKSVKEFTDDTKSGVFIRSALSSALKCPICRGYLDVAKSVSYDHGTRVREGGVGSAENCALTHPYCNQSVKN